MVITNFKGTGSVDKKKLTLDGTYEKMEIDTVTFSNLKLKATSSFNSLQMENLEFSKLELEGSGSVTYRDTEIKLENQSLVLTSPEGIFTFSDSLSMKSDSFLTFCSLLSFSFTKALIELSFSFKL